jgi:hypothetical protein
MAMLQKLHVGFAVLKLESFKSSQSTARTWDVLFVGSNNQNFLCARVTEGSIIRMELVPPVLHHVDSLNTSGKSKAENF